MLAGGETSRLYKTLVRDLRLAKDVSADNDTKEIAGFFTLEATAAEGKSTDEIEKVFQKEIARLKQEAPSPAEIARVLARIETGFYARLTRPIGRAITIASGFAQYDNPHHYRVEFDRYFQGHAGRCPARGCSVPERQQGPAPGPAREVRRGEDGADARRTGCSVQTSPRPRPRVPRLPGRTGPGCPARRSRPPSNLLISPAGSSPTASTSGSPRGRPCRWYRFLCRFPTGPGTIPQGKEGLGNLTARLLDQGTRTRTATELAEAFEQLGAGVRVGAGRDDTSVGVSVLARNLEPTLDLLS